jgi:hypothetical protein
LRPPNAISRFDEYFCVFVWFFCPSCCQEFQGNYNNYASCKTLVQRKYFNDFVILIKLIYMHWKFQGIELTPKVLYCTLFLFLFFLKNIKLNKNRQIKRQIRIQILFAWLRPYKLLIKCAWSRL